MLPCLVTKRGKQITGPANIRKTLQFNTSRTRESTSFTPVPTRNDRNRHDNVHAFDLATTSGFCRLATREGSSKKGNTMNTQNIPEPSYKVGGIREKKVAELEQDLEAMLSERNNIGGAVRMR